MINVVLIEKDMNYSKILINYLNCYNKNLRFCALFNSINEFNNIVNKDNFDIILLNCSLIKSFNGKINIDKCKKFEIFCYNINNGIINNINDINAKIVSLYNKKKLIEIMYKQEKLLSTII